MAAVSPAAADVLHLKNGSTVTVDRWWEEDGEIRYRRAGGIVGVPRQMIERIEATGAAAPAGPQGSGTLRPAPAAPPPASPVLAPALPAGGPEAWAGQLEKVEAAIGRPGVDEKAARREAAVLHTLLGNEAARQGDLEAAESRYQRAVDQDPAFAAPVLNLARIRIHQGRLDDAERLLQNALALKAEDPAALALLADVAYRSGRLEEAIETWDRSLAARPDPEVTARVEKARRELEVVRDYQRTDAPHFTLNYDGDRASGELSREILDHLESVYADLTSRLNAWPASILVVTLYSREAFHDVTESPRWVGGLFDGQIRIPIGGLTRLTGPARSVFTHELTHAIVYHKTHGNAPRWLQEGIAQWVEGKSAARHRRELARAYGAASVSEVAAEFTYPMALSQVEYFLSAYSISHLTDLLDALGRGSDLEAAFASATGDGFGVFLDGWIRSLAAGAGPQGQEAP